MKKLLLIVLLGMFSAAISAQGTAAFFTNADAFLKSNVSSSGGVYYASIKANPAALNKMVDQVGKFPFSSANKTTQKAFLINAYNILCIKNVVDHYPIAKPTSVSGFFDKKKFNVAGMSLTLSDIENKKIRPVYNDSRTHFVLVCAAKSCPPIANFAFMPSKVEAQIEARTKKAMNSRSFIKVNNETKKVDISQIFEWYKSDFDAEAKDALTYINKYRSTPIPSNYKVGFYSYNWALNVKKK